MSTKRSREIGKHNYLAPEAITTEEYLDSQSQVEQMMSYLAGITTGRTDAKLQFLLTPDGLALLTGWARRGLTRSQIAKRLGTTATAVNSWAKKYAPIAECLMSAEELANLAVENSLYQMTQGYSYDEVSVETVDDPEKGQIVRNRTTTRHVQPNVFACLAWLNNRVPDRWKKEPPDPATKEQELARVNNILVAIKEVAVKPSDIIIEPDKGGGEG